MYSYLLYGKLSSSKLDWFQSPCIWYPMGSQDIMGSRASGSDSEIDWGIVSFAPVNATPRPNRRAAGGRFSARKPTGHGYCRHGDRKPLAAGLRRHTSHYKDEAKGLNRVRDYVVYLLHTLLPAVYRVFRLTFVPCGEEILEGNPPIWCEIDNEITHQ